MDRFLTIAARVLMAQLFILSGWMKITGYSGTVGYFGSMGLPGVLVPLVIIIELGGGLLLLFGYKTKWVAIILALFTLGSALIAHLHLSDPLQFINFTKNLAITGGLLLFVKYGAGKPSVDEKD